MRTAFAGLLLSLPVVEALASETEPAAIAELLEQGAAAEAEPAWVEWIETVDEPTADDYLLGARIAESLGQISEVRQRLFLANAVEERQEILDWLFNIGNTFGEVKLVAMKDSELVVKVSPFANDQRAALDFARSAIYQTGTFSGYLPIGSYTLGNEAFEVSPQAPLLELVLEGAVEVQELQPVEETVEEVSERGVGRISLLAGGGTSYGWAGGNAIIHGGFWGARVGGGFDPVFGILSAQLGARLYPTGVVGTDNLRLMPMVEVAGAPLRWQQTGNALYGPALSTGGMAAS